MNIYKIDNGWDKSHITHLKANKTKPNKAKKKSAMHQMKDENLKFH